MNKITLSQHIKISILLLCSFSGPLQAIQQIDAPRHFLHHPERIVWQGWASVQTKHNVKNLKKRHLYATFEENYWMITDDDKAYGFTYPPNKEQPTPLHPKYTIDLASYHYSCLTQKDTLLLSKVNLSREAQTPNNTLVLNHYPKSALNELMYAFRYASHQYYCLQKTNNNSYTLQPLSYKNEPKNVHLVEVNCRTLRDDQRTALLYCLIPQDNEMAYTEWAELFTSFFTTDVVNLTRYGEDISLVHNKCLIKWSDANNHSFTLTLAAYMQQQAIPYPDVKGQSLASPSTQKEKKPLKEKQEDEKEEKYEKDEKEEKYEKEVLQTPKIASPLHNSATICPYLSIASTQRKHITAMSCPLYAQMSQKKRWDQEHLNHLTSYEHLPKLLCPKKNRCPSWHRARSNKATTNNDYLYDLYHGLIFDHTQASQPSRRKRWTLSRWRTSKRKVSDSTTTHPSSPDKKPLPKVKRVYPKNHKNQFTFEATFAKMHSVDLQVALHPLDRLQSPRLPLKDILQEIVRNNADNPKLLEELDFYDQEDVTKLTAALAIVKYVTHHEFPWLREAVESKLTSMDHRNLGSPLNISELTAIALYTNIDACCYDLGDAQRKGDFARWKHWDRYLMQALVKLHIAELLTDHKTTNTLYAGLRKVSVAKPLPGFFKSYQSTSLYDHTAMRFKGDGKGLFIHVDKALIPLLVNADVRWISCHPEGEILFARSADTSLCPAFQWKIKLLDSRDKNTQRIKLLPATQPLVIRKGKTKTLKAAPWYTFSYIKLEEDAKLTVDPWSLDNPQGGVLRIICLGDCILGPNARIDVSKKGYAGGTQAHPQGYGPGGGSGGKYCAAGGSHATLGSEGKARDSFTPQISYHAATSRTYGTPILDKHNLPLGSGGGYIAYEEEGKEGKAGGGSLYLEVLGMLSTQKGSCLCASGGGTTKLTGGAGSGGSICLYVRGSVDSRAEIPLILVSGGSNERGCGSTTVQGMGGAGRGALYCTAKPLLQTRLHNIQVNPNAVKIAIESPLWKQYEMVLHHWTRTYGVNVLPNFLILSYLTAQTTTSYEKIIPYWWDLYGRIFSFRSAYSTLVHAYLLGNHPAVALNPSETPLDHVTIAETYYNAQGKEYYNQSAYDKAVAEHKKALKLLQKREKNSPHPRIAYTHGRIAWSYGRLHAYTQALDHAQRDLSMTTSIYTSHLHVDIAYSHRNMGAVYAFMGGHATQELTCYNKALRILGKLYGTSPHHCIASCYNGLGVVYYTQRQYKQAIDAYQKALHINKELHKDKPNDATACCYHNLGCVYSSKGMYDQVIDAYQKALHINKKLYKDTPHASTALSYNNLGIAYKNKGMYDQAIDAHKKALHIYEKVYKDKPHARTALSYNNLGNAYKNKGMYDQAIDAHKKALHIRIELYKDKPHADTASSYHNLGNAYKNKGMYDQAIDAFQKALHIYEKLYEDKPHASTARSYHNLGFAYQNKGVYDQAIDAYQKALHIYKELYKDKPHADTADSYNNLGNAYRNKGMYDQAIDAFQKALHIYEKVYKDKPHASTANSYYNLGNAYRNKGMYDQAIDAFQKALHIYEKVYKDKPHASTANSYYNLGNAYRNKGMYDQAIDAYQKALHIRIELYKDKPHADTARSYNNLGFAYQNKGMYDQAIDAYKKALHIYEKLHKDKPHADTAKSYNNLGIAYKNKGMYDQAIDAYQKALHIRIELYKDKPHASTANSYHNLGIAYKNKGMYDQAIDAYQKALHIYKELYKDKPHADTADSYNNLGNAYKNKGMYDQAIDAYQKALHIRIELYKDKPHASTANSYNNLGFAYQNKGMHDQAIDAYQKALHIEKKLYKDKPHADTAGSYYNLGCAYQNKGMYDQAIDAYQKALHIRIELYKDKPHADTATSYHNLGFAYKNKGMYDQAIDAYQKALHIYKELYKDKPHADTATSYHNLGFAYKNKGMYDQAIDAYQKALHIYKELYKDKPHADTADSYNNLGNAYKNKGMYDQAIDAHKKALHIRIELYKDKPHADTATSYHNLGFAYKNKGMYDQAIDAYQKALHIYKELYKDKPHADTADSYNNLGNAYKNKGMYDQAIDAHKKALHIRIELYKDKPHADTATSYHNLGFAYKNKGMYDQAIDAYQKALHIYKELYKDKPHADTADSYNNLGNAYKNKGMYDQAIDAHKKALHIRIELYKDKPHADTANSYNNLGSAYQKKGMYDQAINYFQLSIQAWKDLQNASLVPDMAAPYYGLGYVYYAQNKYSKALPFLTKAHTIYTKTLGAQHERTKKVKQFITIVKQKL